MSTTAPAASGNSATVNDMTDGMINRKIRFIPRLLRWRSHIDFNNLANQNATDYLQDEHEHQGQYPEDGRKKRFNVIGIDHQKREKDAERDQSDDHPLRDALGGE